MRLAAAHCLPQGRSAIDIGAGVADTDRQIAAQTGLTIETERASGDRQTRPAKPAIFVA
jgi:hypothetical protein